VQLVERDATSGMASSGWLTGRGDSRETDRSPIRKQFYSIDIDGLVSQTMINKILIRSIFELYFIYIQVIFEDSIRKIAAKILD